MSVFQEFCDANMHRSYPLVDGATATDLSGSFSLPLSLLTDVFLCLPNIPGIDPAKCYLHSITVRRFTLDVYVGYDDPSTPGPFGVFKGIDTAADLFRSYSLTALENQTVDTAFRPLYFSSGQLVVGDPKSAMNMLGSWSFAPAQTYLVASRVCLGAVNLQYLYVNDVLYTGKVRLKEGANVTLVVTPQQVLDGVPTTIITVNAALAATASAVNLNSDSDVLNALVDRYGRPINKINNIRPGPDYNFTLQGLDCTELGAVTHGLTLANPCASPCCSENDNVANLMSSVASLNLRYAQLDAFQVANGAAVDQLQRKLMVLGAGL